MKPEKLTVGVDLGGTNIALGLVTARGQVLRRAKVPTLAGQGPARVLERMAVEVRKLVTGLPRKRLLAVGVGSPGPLNAHSGHVTGAPNLPGWKRIHVTAILKKKIGLPVFLENDARCATLGEAAYGAGKGCQNLIMLTLGTGVGGGFILDGKLVIGPDTTAGEMGHMPLNPLGPPCNCGQRGCLEQYASATAIARRARQALAGRKSGPLWKLCGGDLSKVTAKMAHEALAKGDPSAKLAWKEACWALGTAVAGYINIFNPERVILFGGVMQGGREILSETRRLARKGAFPHPGRRARIVRASLGDDAGLVGAAEMARRRMAA